jgi:hypothetical protein
MSLLLQRRAIPRTFGFRNYGRPCYAFNVLTFCGTLIAPEYEYVITPNRIAELWKPVTEVYYSDQTLAFGYPVRFARNRIRNTTALAKGCTIRICLD